MLSFTDTITYDPWAAVFFIAGLIIIIIGMLGFIFDKDDSLFISICLMIVGIVIAGMGGIVILNSNITSETITPCNIIVGNSGYSSLIADTSDHVYFASPEVTLKLHLNQSTNVIIENRWGGNHPIILSSTGSTCSPNIMNCQSVNDSYWTYNKSMFNGTIPSDQNVTYIPV